MTLPSSVISLSSFFVSMSSFSLRKGLRNRRRGLRGWWRILNYIGGRAIQGDLTTTRATHVTRELFGRRFTEYSDRFLCHNKWRYCAPPPLWKVRCKVLFEQQKSWCEFRRVGWLSVPTPETCRCWRTFWNSLERFLNSFSVCSAVCRVPSDKNLSAFELVSRSTDTRTT